MKSAKSKIALVTGASRGLGKFCCLTLAKQGYQVIGLSRTSWDKLDSDLQSALITYYSIDLADTQAVATVLKEVKDVDLLVVNSSHRNFGEFQNFIEADISKLITGTFTNQLIMMNTWMKGMLDRNSGAVILVSSKAAYNGYSSGSLYCSVKAAWMSVFESVSKELSTSKVALINFLPDSFTTNSGEPLAAKSLVEKKLLQLLSKPLDQMRTAELRILTRKNKALLAFNLIKKLFR
jgi:short-subunit dehydrogenase